MRPHKNNDDDFDLDFFSQMGNRSVVVTEQTMMSTAYRIWLDEDIKEAQYYRRAFEVLETANESDFIYLHIDSIGGHLGTALKFVNAIHSSSAQVMGVLENRAFSAGSMILLACPRIMVKPYSTFMAHSVSAGVGGELQKMVNYSGFLKKESDRIIDDIYTGFLTPQEIDSVKQGKAEIWLKDEEVLKRLDSLSEYKKQLKASLETDEEVPVKRKSRARGPKA